MVHQPGRQRKVQLLAEAAGGPVHLIDPETAAATAAVNGSPEVGRLQFSLLWKLITAQEPELLN